MYYEDGDRRKQLKQGIVVEPPKVAKNCSVKRKEKKTKRAESVVGGSVTEMILLTCSAAEDVVNVQ